MNENSLPPEILEKLRLKYLASLPKRLDLIREAIDIFKKEPSQKNAEGLGILVHTLSGNAGTYGYDNVTILCSKWDKKLSQVAKEFPECKLDILFFSELEGFFKKIKEEFGLHQK